MTHPNGGSPRLHRRLRSTRRSARLRLVPERLETRLTPTTGSIQGSLWNDFNSDGVKGANEPALAGRTVFLDQNQDGMLDNGEVSTTTASDGSYSFTNLAPGTYYVAQVVPNGWQQTSPTLSPERTVTLSGVGPYVFTFTNLANLSGSTIPAYHENGFTFNTSAQQPMQFYVYGNSSSPEYAGAPALFAEWAPSTISLTQDNGAPFSANSIALSTIWNSIYYPTVTFTGTHPDGTQVQQSFNLSNTLGFQNETFTGFDNIVSLTWNSTSTSDYHQFTNVSITAAAPTNVSGVNFGSVDTGLPPTAGGDSYAVNEGSTLSPSAPGVLANDSNPTGAPLSIVIDSNPTHGSLSLNAQTGAFTYTPTAYYFGSDSFRYHLVANGLSSSVATVSLTVNHVNQPPVVVTDSYNVTKNTTLTVAALGVLANDSDPDGNPFTAVPASGSTSHGSYTLNANGSFTYTPNANYLGPDSFSYHATDGSATSSYAIVNLTVTGSNDAPTAGANAYSVNENATLTVVVPGVLGNDSDPNGQPISATVYTQPAHGTLGLNSNGSFTYTPAANYYGTDSFTYRASDGSLYSSPATVSLTINQVFSPPTATADSYATAENTTLTVSAPGILANDTDPNGLTLTPVVTSPTSNGTLTVNPDGSFTYVPNHNFYGTDSFNYYVTDGQAYSIYATDTITVTHVNQPPVATNDTYTVAENGSLSAVTGVSLVTMSSQPGDYIGQGNTYTFSPGSSTFSGTVMTGGAYTNTVRIIVSGPGNEWWSFAFVAPNQATLVPGVYNNAVRWPFQQGTQPGLDVSGDGRGSNTLTGQFTVYQADYDANGNIVSFDATFEQHSEGKTPALTGHVQFHATGGLPFGVLANDTDPDNDPLQATLVSNPAHGSVNFHSDGSFTYTPAANYSGPDSFTYKANDGAFDSNVATVSLNVAFVNQAPSFTASSPIAVNEGSGAQSLANWAHFNPGPGNGDAGQTASYLVANLSNPSLFSVAPTVSPGGTLSFTPAPNAFGSATFQLAVRDSGGTANGGSDTGAYQTFQINVAQVAHAPSLSAPSATGAEGAPILLGIAAATTNTTGSESLSIAIKGVPAGVTLSAGSNQGNGVWLLTPAQLNNLSLTAPDNSTFKLTITATATASTDGATASTSIVPTYTVTNVAPTVSISGDSSGVRGQARTFALSATDPSSADRTAGFSYSVNWGDGSPIQVVPVGQPSTLLHTFVAAGNYTVKATATDKDGSAGPTATYGVAITPWAIQPDPFSPGSSDLVIGGTTAADTINLYVIDGSNTLGVSINDTQSAHFTPPTANGFARIIVYGQAGNDNIHFTANITSPAWLYGGDGDDQLLGGSGNNVIVAGAGDDVVNRRTGADLIIAGDGADRIYGQSTNNLIIAGTTAFDANDAALAAIDAEWTSSRPRATRVANLSGTGTGTRLNGGYFLVAGSTVFDDLAADIIHTFPADSTPDWVFYDKSRDKALAT